MKKTMVLLMSLVGLGGAVAAQDEPDARQKALAAVQPQVGLNNKFAVELFGKLSKPGENMFFSPYSISQAMGMTYAGARGNTAAEIATAMGFSEASHESMKQLSSVIGADAGENEIDIANSFWAQKDEKFLPDFLKTLETSYAAQAHSVNFSQGDKASAEINGWVAQKTRNLISQIVSPKDIDSLTRLILVNAIYFEGVWRDKFKTTDTKPDVFFGAKGEFLLPFMRSTEYCLYKKADGVQTLAKSYKGGSLEMLILLPDDKNGLPQLEKSLTAQKLEQLTAGLESENIELHLPKFKAESSFSLSDYLNALGIKDAFTMAADFSGMNGGKDLYISKVLHKAFVDVDEEGTKAAAATAVIMRMKSMRMVATPVVVRVNHPFIYMIRHVRTGAILFMGKFGEEKSGSAPGKEQISSAQNAEIIEAKKTAISIEAIETGKATVNGKAVVVGDVVEGCKVVEIGGFFVSFEINGETFKKYTHGFK